MDDKPVDKKTVCDVHLDCRQSAQVAQQFCDICSMEQHVYQAVKHKDVDMLKSSFSKCLSAVHTFSSAAPVDVQNETVLMCMVKEQFYDGLQYILFDRIDCTGDISSTQAQAAFLHAVRFSMPKIVRLFLRAFVEDRLSMEMASVFHMAIFTGQLGMLPDIINKDSFNADMEITWGLDRPLHIAVVYQQPGLTRLLLEKGGSVDIMDRKGKTPLIIGCSIGALECVKILLQYGADPNHKASCDVFPPISPLHVLLKFSHYPQMADSVVSCLVYSGLNLRDELWVMTMDAGNSVSSDTLCWLKKLCNTPQSLKLLSLVAIRTRLVWLHSGMRLPQRINCLPLPQPMKAFLRLDHL